MSPLLQQLTDRSKLSMLRNATWTLSNFCRGKPQPSFEHVRPALPTLAQLIHSVDEEVSLLALLPENFLPFPCMEDLDVGNLLATTRNVRIESWRHHLCPALE